MTQRLLCLVVLAFLVTTATATYGKELVRNFTGSRSTETAEFEVRSPWLLDWWVNGEYPQMLGLEVSLIDATTGQHAGYVLKTKHQGSGVRAVQAKRPFPLEDRCNDVELDYEGGAIDPPRSRTIHTRGQNRLLGERKIKPLQYGIQRLLRHHERRARRHRG